MKFVALLALSLAGVGAAQAAENWATPIVSPSDKRARADNLTACVGYYYAMIEAVEQADFPIANRTLHRASALTQDFASGSSWGDYWESIDQSRQVFMARLRSDRSHFLQATQSIAEDCARTFNEISDSAQRGAMSNRTPEDFTIRGTVMRLSNVALGDRPSACDGALITQAGPGTLKSCTRGSEADQLSIFFEGSGKYVIKVERTMLLDHRRFDWKKFIVSARAYGEPDVHNLDQWLVGYGNNFSVSGPDNDPVIEWKESGRGVLLKGNSCGEDGCRGVAGTNVEVKVTLLDSDEFQAAMKTPKLKPSLDAAGHNLAVRSIAEAVAAAKAEAAALAEAEAKRKEALAAAERAAQEEERKKRLSREQEPLLARTSPDRTAELLKVEEREVLISALSQNGYSYFDDVDDFKCNTLVDRIACEPKSKSGQSMEIVIAYKPVRVEVRRQHTAIDCIRMTDWQWVGQRLAGGC